MNESEAESRNGGSPARTAGTAGAEGAPAAPTTDSPALFHGAPTIDLPTADGAGLWIGPYRILQLLGEGGFGSVFMAEQSEPIHRRAEPSNLHGSTAAAWRVRREAAGGAATQAGTP